jgi:CBS domain containing-hemolysin-like protein
MKETTPPATGFARLRLRVAGKTEHAILNPEAQAIHDRVEQLSELELRDVMTPRVDVAYLTMPVTPEAIAEAVRDTGHSCFPVVIDDDLDEVQGVLFVNDLFRSTTAKRAIGVSLPDDKEIARKIRTPMMLPETLDLLEGFKEMREQRRTFAIVLDEHGGVAGVLSIRDILEQLVGDLNDEFDEEDAVTIVKIRPGRWLIDGQTHIDKVRETLGVDIPEGDYVTLAGFLLSVADEIPPAGKTYTRGDWSFRVQSVVKQRISEIVVEHHEPVAPDDSDD